MTDKEFLTEWLIKYGMEWVESRYLGAVSLQLSRSLWSAYIEQRYHTNDLSGFLQYRLTQKALDYINDG